MRKIISLAVVALLASSYLRCAFDSYGFQRLATGKGCCAHLRHRLRYHHFLQVIAGKESLSTYLLQLIWQDDML